MSMSKIGLCWLSAGALALAAVTVLPATASAQLLFDWGGPEKKVNDSGRQLVRINSDAKPGEIIVSFSDRRLFLITQPGMAFSYPVAIPREQDRWQGQTSVTQKRENPSWTPTPSMIKENPRLPRWVPGGHPMNPLGNRALYLGSSFYRIHGTDAPWTIGTAVSKGCIRMYNKDALDVYERAKVGAKVMVTWKTYQFQPTPDQPQAIATQAQPDAAARYHSPAGRGVERIDRGERDQQPAPSPRRWRQPAETADLDVPPTERAAAAPREASPAETPQSRRSRENREARQQSQSQREAREPRERRETQRDRSAEVPAAQQPREAIPQAATPAAAPPATPAPKARSDAGQKAATIETGSVNERRPRAKAPAPVVEQSTDTPKAAPQAQAAPQPDIAAKALEAAERAAAAAERAAAAAERAERAVNAKAAAPAAPVPSPPPSND